MTTDTTIPSTNPSDEAAGSRRDIVAAAVTVAAAAGATSTARARAPTGLSVRFLKPAGMSSPPTYSHVVEVTGPHRTVYIAGQTGADAAGKVADGFRAQAVQVFENMKIALAAIGGNFSHVVKINSYLTNVEANAPEFREVRALYFTDKASLPAATLVQVPRLASPAYLLEVEAIAILPPRT